MQRREYFSWHFTMHDFFLVLYQTTANYLYITWQIIYRQHGNFAYVMAIITAHTIVNLLFLYVAQFLRIGTDQLLWLFGSENNSFALGLQKKQRCSRAFLSSGPPIDPSDSLCLRKRKTGSLSLCFAVLCVPHAQSLHGCISKKKKKVCMDGQGACVCTAVSKCVHRKKKERSPVGRSSINFKLPAKTKQRCINVPPISSQMCKGCWIPQYCLGIIGQ